MARHFAPRRGGPGRWLVIMAKEPRAGAVKTRLARDLGVAGAMRFYRASIGNTVRRLDRPGRWSLVLAVSPEGALGSPVWPGRSRIRQGRGDLGARMQRIFCRMPPGPVVIVGTDIPAIRARHVAAAFDALGFNDAVFGPAADGGYWLVGLRRTPAIRRIFDQVRWSGPHALKDTLANLDGAAVAMLDELEDVDDGDSHRRLANADGRVVLPAKLYKLS